MGDGYSPCMYVGCGLSPTPQADYSFLPLLLTPLSISHYRIRALGVLGFLRHVACLPVPACQLASMLMHQSGA